MNDLMTNSSGAQLPAFVNKGKSSILDAMQGGLSQGAPSISLRNSRFHFKKDGAEIGTADTTYLDVVLVGGSEYIHRAYYEKAYDGESDAKPTCTSHRGDVPDGGDTKQHDSCKFCPKNKKQPDPRRPGKDYTPCGFSKDIAVMIPGDPTKTVWRLKLSGMTLFNSSNDGKVMAWKALLNKFASIGADPLHYVVRLSFDTEASVPVLNFSVQAMVGDGTTHYDEAFYNAVVEKIEAGVPMEVVGDTAEPVGTIENQEPAPQEMPVQSAPVQQAPVQQAPVSQEMPVQSAPAQQAQPAPIQETPAQQVSDAEVEKATNDAMDSDNMGDLLGMFK